MIDKVSKLAERVATNLSRRRFLGRLGQGALVLAGALGGFLAFPTFAQADSGVGCCDNRKCPKPKGQGKCNFAGVDNCQAAAPMCVWNCKGVIVKTPCT